MEANLQEQLKESKEAFDALMKEHQDLLKHSRVLGVGLVSLKLERFEESVDKRFAKLRKDPKVAVLKERLDKQKASLLSAQEAMHKMKGRLDALEQLPADVPPDMNEFGEP